MRAALLALVLAGGLGSGAAAPIYRCGAVYTQTPCEGGRVLEQTDGRTAAQRAEALRVAALERRRAAELARERRAEAAAARAAAAAPEPPASTPKRRKVKTGPVKPAEPIGTKR